MNVVSAYLLMQKSTVEDPLNPEPDIKPKSWFKQILRDHPTDFPQYMKFELDLGSGRMVTDYGNTYKGSIVNEWKAYLISPPVFNEAPNYWARALNGDYMSPGCLQTFHNVEYYELHIGNGLAAGNGIIRVEPRNEDPYTTGVYMTQFAIGGKEELWTSPTDPFAGSFWTCYGIPVKVYVPVYTDETLGVQYANAVTRYWESPTQANYEAVCSYIDLCQNPDAGN